MILRRGIYSQRFVSGPDYQKINFDSSFQDNVNLGNSIANNVRTIQFYWSPQTDVTPSTPLKMIAQRFNNYTGDEIYLFISNGLIYLLLRHVGTSVQIHTNSSSWLSSNTYFLSFVMHPTQGTSIYVDGVKQQNTSPITSDSGVLSNDFYLGSHPSGHPSFTSINQSIYNLQFWNVARTQSEILTDKDTYYPVGTTGLVDTFHFTDELGFTVNGVNGNTGTINTNNPLGVTYVNTVMREKI